MAGSATDLGAGAGQATDAGEAGGGKEDPFWTHKMDSNGNLRPIDFCISNQRERAEVWTKEEPEMPFESDHRPLLAESEEKQQEETGCSVVH